MNRLLIALGAVFFAWCSIESAQADIATLEAFDYGYYLSDGTHPDHESIFTGNNPEPGHSRASFFNFDVSSLSGTTIHSVHLSFSTYYAYYFSPDESETLLIWDVTTNPGFVSSSVAIYDDLVSGTLYSSTVVSTPGSSGVMPQISLALNSFSYQDILAHNSFSLGASLAGMGNIGESGTIWNGTDGDTQVFLTVEYTSGPAPVPEPATVLLFGMGAAGLIGTRLRGKK